MDLTKLINIQALDFDIWGLHVKANLIMSILILVTILGCWIWYKRKLLDISRLAEQHKVEQERHKFEIEKYSLELEKLKQEQLFLKQEQSFKLSELEANRKKPTWCHACDVNRVFLDWVPVPGDETYIIKRYICPSCKSTDYCRKNK